MFNHLSPHSLATPPQITEYLVLQQMAQDFRREVEHRTQFEAYCQWYYQTATDHRQALTRMGKELNILAWFRGR